MITAIIRNKENTLVLDFPRSIYDLYEKLQSVGIMRSPKQIPLTDSEDEDIGVKLFSESDFGQHLLLTLNEKNTIADANMLTLVIGAASEDIKEELEQNILYDQYDSMDEVINAVRQMTQDAGPVKAVFFCPLIGNIDEGDGDMFTVGDSYLADSVDEIADALNRYTANDENDMATYYNKDDGVSQKLTSAVWSVDKPGVYTVTETEYDKYIPQEVRRVTVVSGQVSTVNFSNKLRRGDLTVKKTAEDGLTEGMKFHLYGTSLSGIEVNE